MSSRHPFDREAPGERRGFVHKRIFGAASAFIGSGFSPTAAAAGFIRPGGRSARVTRAELGVGSAGGGPRRNKFGVPDPNRGPGGCNPGTKYNPAADLCLGAGGLAADTGTCPGVAIKIRGVCVDPTALFPGGRPAFGPTTGTDLVRGGGGGAAVVGSFGFAAMEPEAMTSVRLQCPPGMVLGRDDLCYPKSVLRRNSKWRKWRPGTRPVLTGGQRASIRKARSAITDAREAISGLGVTVTKKK